jgi:NADH dehydrogenase
VPDPSDPSKPTPPTAQFALRQGRTCANNVAASLTGGQLRKFNFRGLGLLVNLANNEGVAKVLGIPVSGRLGWLVTRAYHVLAVPTVWRRVRVLVDYTLAIGDRPDIAEMGTIGKVGTLDSEV